MASTTSKPSARQMSYLRWLANRAGQTFTYPSTAQQASAEINRLKIATVSSHTERYHERKLIADQIQAGPQDAARVCEHEISGHGSSATWTQNRDQDPPPVQDPGPAAGRHRSPGVGKRTELARYTVPDGERILSAQRVDGVVTDRPAGAGGRSYLVERGLQTKAELDALLADYLTTAKLDRPPMSVCPLDSYLEAIA